MKQRPPISEGELAAGLQPIRYFVLAQALYHFIRLGLQNAIATSAPISIDTLAKNLNLQNKRLSGFLHYLANEGFVEITKTEYVSLTRAGQEIVRFSPWYTLLIGGYAPTFRQLDMVLRAGGAYASRNSAEVAIGSCGISQYDALPMTRRLLHGVAGQWQTIIDIGCGDGSYLLDLCTLMPDAHGIGLDPTPETVDVARSSVKMHGLANRVEIMVGSATQIPDLSHKPAPFSFITAFVLQEVLEQSGRAALLDVLTSTFSRYPDAYWVVIEVDHRPDDTMVMANPLGLAYYNPYYLIHTITEQKLELGGADSLDNIWPQCGPTGFDLAERYFKIKDGVEDYLAAQVRTGKMDLQEAQEGIAKDWTLYLHDSQDYWKTHKRPSGGGE